MAGFLILTLMCSVLIHINYFTALAVKNPFLMIIEDHYHIIYCHSSKYPTNACCFKYN